jgi:hypothetical protein
LIVLTAVALKLRDDNERAARVTVGVPDETVSGEVRR